MQRVKKFISDNFLGLTIAVGVLYITYMVFFLQASWNANEVVFPLIGFVFVWYKLAVERSHAEKL